MYIWDGEDDEDNRFSLVAVGAAVQQHFIVPLYLTGL
jgi:hypothetical protein